MKNFISQYTAAIKAVLRDGTKYKVAFVIATVLLFLGYMFLPVWTVPGNSIAFQLSLLRTQDYASFFVLSVITALLFTMQLFLFLKNKEIKRRLESAGSASGSMFSAVFGGLLATAACSSCIAAIVGFLGAGSVFFVLDYQWYFVTGALILVALGFYFSVRRINGYCKDCEIKINQL